MPSNTSEYQREYRKSYNQRMRNVSVALPIGLYEQWKQLAVSCGMPLAAFLREATLAQMQGFELRSKAISQELKELRFLILNMANNLNQIAHHANRTGEVMEIESALEALQQSLGAINAFADLRSNQKTGSLFQGAESNQASLSGLPTWQTALPTDLMICTIIASVETQKILDENSLPTASISPNGKTVTTSTMKSGASPVKRE